MFQNIITDKTFKKKVTVSIQTVNKDNITINCVLSIYIKYNNCYIFTKLATIFYITIHYRREQRFAHAI